MENTIQRIEFDESKENDVNFLLEYTQNSIDYYSQFTWGEKIVLNAKKRLKKLQKTITKASS